MKPNPLSSLNHFTVPVGMWELLHGTCVLRRGGCCSELRPASACTTFRRSYVPARQDDRSRALRSRVVELLRPGLSDIRAFGIAAARARGRRRSVGCVDGRAGGYESSARAAGAG